MKDLGKIISLIHEQCIPVLVHHFTGILILSLYVNSQVCQHKWINIPVRTSSRIKIINHKLNFTLKQSVFRYNLPLPIRFGTP